MLHEVEEPDSLRRVRSVLTKRTDCTISIAVPVLVTAGSHTPPSLAAIKGAAGGSSQVSVAVTDQEPLHCCGVKRTLRMPPVKHEPKQQVEKEQQSGPSPASDFISVTIPLVLK